VKQLWSLLLKASMLFGLVACQSPAGVGVNDTSSSTNLVKITALHEMVGPQVLPPPGFTDFCARDQVDCLEKTGEHSSPTVLPSPTVLTPERWVELNKINDYVNRTVGQIDDMDNYGVIEYWSLPNSRGGDCEDLVLLKRKLLIERGWPAQDLLITMVREWNGAGHAVLTVSTDRGDYILDNKNYAILLWNEAPYIWIKRQSPGNAVVWEGLEPSNSAMVSLGKNISSDQTASADQSRL